MLSYERKKQQKIKTLKLIKKFEVINRLFCYACAIPFFYTASCLGQQKETSFATKVGAAGFVTSVMTALIIKRKEEKTENELEKIIEKRQKFRY